MRNERGPMDNHLSTPLDPFFVDGIYYRVISGANVWVTNQMYPNDYADSCNSYSGDITIPATVTHNKIGYAVTAIGANAFRGSTALSSVTLPPTIQLVGSRAFSDCTNLASLTLNEGLKSIGALAFENCSKLASLHIPASLSGINASNPIFAGCSQLDISAEAGGCFSVTDGVLFERGDGDHSGNTRHFIRWIPEKKAGEYIIPDEVVNIGVHSISGNGLSGINIPANVETIQRNNFRSCENLTEITLNWKNPTTVAMSLLTSPFVGMIKSDITLRVPAGTAALYIAHELWGEGFKIVEQ